MLQLDKGHRVILLTTIKRILDERKDQVEDALGYSIVTTAFRELTMEKEVVPDWQTAASSVLVSIGEVRSQHVTQVKQPPFFSIDLGIYTLSYLETIRPKKRGNRTKLTQKI